MRKTVVQLRELQDACSGAQQQLLEALSRDGFCFVESRGCAAALDGLLLQLVEFFATADEEDKRRIEYYRSGVLRGYFPPFEPHSRKLEHRKERLVFGNQNNRFPGKYPGMKPAYENLYLEHVSPIADAVIQTVAGYLAMATPSGLVNFDRFLRDPCSKKTNPGVLCYAMHYPKVANPLAFVEPDQSVTISDPHVDMTTLTILPRGTGGTTKMFDETGRIVPIYDNSIPSDALLIFAGLTLEKLLQGIPFQNNTGRFPFRAFLHTVKIAPDEVARDRDVVGYFFNGNPDRSYISAATGDNFGSIFLDRRPPWMKQLEPLSGTELTVRDRQYLTEKLFFSNTSPNAASPPVTLKQFRSANSERS